MDLPSSKAPQSPLSPLYMLHAKESPVFHSRPTTIRALDSLSPTPIPSAQTALLSVRQCSGSRGRLVWWYLPLLERERGRMKRRLWELPRRGVCPYGAGPAVSKENNGEINWSSMQWSGGGRNKGERRPFFSTMAATWKFLWRLILIIGGRVFFVFFAFFHFHFF